MKIVPTCKQISNEYLSINIQFLCGHLEKEVIKSRCVRNSLIVLYDYQIPLTF